MVKNVKKGFEDLDRAAKVYEKREKAKIKNKKDGRTSVVNKDEYYEW